MKRMMLYSSLRRALGLSLAASLLVGTLAPALLDRDLAATVPVLESEHGPETCASGHDHRNCVLVASSQWHPVPPTCRGTAPTIAVALVFEPGERTPFAGTFSTPLPRAPPPPPPA